MPAEEWGVSGQGEVVHIGGYTAQSGGRGSGIVAARRDPRTGALTPLGTVAVTPSPSFLARHPTQPVLYAVNELTDGEISAWQVGGGRRAGPARQSVDRRCRALPPGGAARRAVTCWRPTTAAAASRSSRSTRRACPASAPTWWCTRGTAPTRSARTTPTPTWSRPGRARGRSSAWISAPTRSTGTTWTRRPDDWCRVRPGCVRSPAPAPGTWPGTPTDGAATSSVSWTPRSPPTS